MMFNCKKYPKGEFSNKANKNIRGDLYDFYTKKWLVKSYKINGIDSTSSFKTKASGNVGIALYNTCDIIMNSQTKNEFRVSTEYYSFNGELVDNKTHITFKPTSSDDAEKIACISNSSIPECEKNIFYPEPFRNENLKWKILKLTKDNFWITARGNFSYEILLTYVED